MTKLFIIYTTSQFPCIWCIRAKKLLDHHEHEYEERDIHKDDFYKSQFIELGFKTVPQIYYDGDYIGGYEKLRKYLDDRD